MKTTSKKKTTVMGIIFVCLVIASIEIVFSEASFRASSAYAIESDEVISAEVIKNNNLLKEEGSEKLRNANLISGDGGGSSKRDRIAVLSGTYYVDGPYPTCRISEFTNMSTFPTLIIFL